MFVWDELIHELLYTGLLKILAEFVTALDHVFLSKQWAIPVHIPSLLWKDGDALILIFLKS